MRTLLLVGLLTTTFAACGYAQTFFGAGGISCSVVTTAARTSDPMRFTYGQWALGYASGLNAAWKIVKGTDPMMNLEPDHVTGYVQRYCIANSNRTLVTAVNDWFASLHK